MFGGIFGLLTLLLVAAKLFGYAHYSWLVAFAPLGVGIVLGLLFFGGLVTIAALLEGKGRR